MSNEERAIMEQHVAYWKKYVDNGTVIVIGPVMDPKGGYGIGVVWIDPDETLQKLIAKDPANGLNSFEIYPMKAITKHS